MPKLWTKHALLVIFHQKCLVWVFLGYNFLKNYFPYLKSAPSNLQNLMVLISKFCEKTKMLKFGTKNVCLGYFLSGISKCFWCFCNGIWKEYCHIWNQYPWTRNFAEKQKFPNYGLNMTKYWLFLRKKVLFGYFCAKIKKKSYCNIWNHNPQISLLAKCCEEKKIPEFGNKSSCLWHFWACICLIANFRRKTKISKFTTKNALFGFFGQ